LVTNNMPELHLFQPELLLSHDQGFWQLKSQVL
jgi:hypothetical protein